MNDSGNAKKHLPEKIHIEEIDIPQDDDENWLVSYADMMTLLFGFFAMMFTFTSLDHEGYIRIRKEIAKHFGGSDTSQVHAVQGSNSIWKNGEYRFYDDGLEVSFVTHLMFKTGSSELMPAAEKGLEQLIALILDVVNQNDMKRKVPLIKVEGHTDDVPISKGSFWGSNWELSAARAASVVRLFESKGFPSDSLTAVGYGSTKPVLPNRDPAGVVIPENQTKNRRVIIKVIFVDPNHNESS